MALAAIASTLTGVGDVINNIVDKNKRRNYEIAAANLSATQQAELNKQLATAKMQSDREAILANALTALQSTKIQQEAEKSRQQNNLKIALIISGSVLAIGLIVVIILKKNK